MTHFLNKKNLLYLTIILAPLYLFRFKFFSIPTNFLELLILCNVALLFWDKKSIEKKISTIPWEILVSIGMIFTGTIISILSNKTFLIGFGILKGWFVLPLLFAYTIYVTFEIKSDLEKALFGIYLSAFLLSLIGLFYKFLNLLTFDNRLEIFYSSPNYLAMYLAIGIIAGSYFFEKINQSKSNVLKIFFTLSFALTGLVFFWTYSYAAWFSVFFSIIIVSAFYQSRKHFLKTFFIITVLLFLVLFFQINTQKFSDLTNHPEKSSLASRIMIWNVAEKLALENPISGIGPGNFQKEYLAAQPSFPPYLEWAVPQPHNLFLAFWLQTGLIGLFGFVFLACNIFIFLLKKENKNSLDWVLFSFLLYTLIHGLVDTPFWKNDLSFLFWFFIAFFLLIKQKEKDFQK